MHFLFISIVFFHVLMLSLNIPIPFAKWLMLEVIPCSATYFAISSLCPSMNLTHLLWVLLGDLAAFDLHWLCSNNGGGWTLLLNNCCKPGQMKAPEDVTAAMYIRRLVYCTNCRGTPFSQWRLICKTLKLCSSKVWRHIVYVTKSGLGVLYVFYGTRCGFELLIKHETKLSALSHKYL